MIKITALIFDLGGVILNLDQNRTMEAFIQLGANTSHLQANRSLFNDLETGKISPDDFRQGLRSYLYNKVTTEEIDTAWNAMLLDLPVQRLQAIEKLKQVYRVYLFSNTNVIHLEFFYTYLQQHHPKLHWLSLFDCVYYSCHIGKRKPHKEAFDYLLQDAGLQASSCLFIDDSKENLEGATQAGIHTLWAKHPFDEPLQMELKRRLHELNGLTL
jgi:glucose-1-phosphatase